MPIGTSNGEYFEDEFDKAHTEMFGVGGTYDPKTDTFVSDQDRQPAKIYVARHGSTPENAESGNSPDSAPIRKKDVSLDDLGRSQAQELAEKVSKEPIRQIFSSPLPRALETTSIVNNKLKVPVREHPGLAAWDLGDLEGKEGKEVHDEVDRLVLNAPDSRPPGGESFNEFKGRVLNTFKEIAQEHPEGAMTVAHGSVLRVLDSQDQDTGDFDYKRYVADRDVVQPGQHKIIDIKDPSRLVQNEGPLSQISPWASGTGANFNERFEGQKEGAPLGISTGPGLFSDQTHKDYQNRNFRGEPWSRDMHEIPPLFPDEAFMKYPNYTPELIPNYGGREDYLRKYYGMDINKEPANQDFSPSIQQRDKAKEISDKEYPRMFPDIIPMPLKKGWGGSRENTGGARPGAGRPAADINWGTFKRLKESGMDLKSIAKELGVSETTLYQARKREGQKIEDYSKSEKNILEPTNPQIVPDEPFQEVPNPTGKNTMKELSDWMKNQFEGPPTEPELINSMKKYITNYENRQLRVPANQNPKFPETPPEGMAVGLFNPKLGVKEQPGHKWAVFDKYGIVTTGFNKQDALNTLYSRQPGLIEKARKPSEQINPSPYDEAVQNESWKAFSKKMQDLSDKEVKEQKKSKFKVIENKPPEK